MTSILKADRVQSTSVGLFFSAGGIIQTQYLQDTAQRTATILTNVALDHLAVNITPISTSSIIRIDAMVNGEWSNQIVL